MARLQSQRDKPGTAREYETTYILRPNTTNEGVAEVNTRIKGIIEGMGGKIIKVDNWGKRRLAYEVAKERKGIYLYWQYLAAPGVVEETAFRGYIQGGIERRYGLTTAILVTGSLFGLSHVTHPEVGLVLLPFYMSVAAVYGLLAAATNSTYPSMLLHAGGNVFSAFSLFTQGRSEWQLTAVPPPTIWQGGIDGSFFANLAMLAVAGAATVMAYRGLFGASRAAA